MEDSNKEPFVLVSVFKENAKPEEVANATPALSLIIDEWHNSGKMIWSGSFDDNRLQCLLLRLPKMRLKRSIQDMIA